MNRSMPGLPVHHHLPEFTQTHVHRVHDAIQPSHPLLTLLGLPPIPPSITVFSNESALLMRWPKYWSFSGKESACSAGGDAGSILGLGSSPGEGKGYPLQYSGLVNSMAYMGLQRVGHD